MSKRKFYLNKLENELDYILFKRPKVVTFSTSLDIRFIPTKEENKEEEAELHDEDPENYPPPDEIKDGEILGPLNRVTAKIRGEELCLKLTPIDAILVFSKINAKIKNSLLPKCFCIDTTPYFLKVLRRSKRLDINIFRKGTDLSLLKKIEYFRFDSIDHLQKYIHHLSISS